MEVYWTIPIPPLAIPIREYVSRPLPEYAGSFTAKTVEEPEDEIERSRR
jgi:hypothetical protein